MQILKKLKNNFLKNKKKGVLNFGSIPLFVLKRYVLLAKNIIKWYDTEHKNLAIQKYKR